MCDGLSGAAENAQTRGQLHLRWSPKEPSHQKHKKISFKELSANLGALQIRSEEFHEPYPLLMIAVPLWEQTLGHPLETEVIPL